MVSVILIATDAVTVLDSTVKSVLAQTMPEWEMVIVDNGSTDKTAERAQHWVEQDPRITTMSIPRTTAAMARQAGVERSAKRWFTFLNAGDKLTPDALKWLSSHMTDEVSMVSTGIVRSTSRGSYVLRGDYSGLLSVPQFVEGLLNYDLAHDVGGKLFRHELFMVPDTIADQETSRHHQLITIISTLPRDGQVYVNTSSNIYESSDTGPDYPQVMNFRGWVKSIDVMAEYVPPSESFFKFRIHSLYRCCIMQGAMFNTSDPTIKALKAEGRKYDLVAADKRILRLLNSRRLRRKEWSHGPLVPSAGDIVISMVMAAYNDAELMMKAIKSLQAQTFMHWELLIIDDSSNDRTPEVIRSIGMSDARVRWIRTSKSIGRYRISRLGVAAACGEYIGFINPDDKLGNRSLEYMWKCASTTDADMVVMGSRLISTHGWLSFPQFEPRRVFDQPVMGTYEIMSGMLCGTGVPWQQYGRIYRREYLRKADMSVSFDSEDHLFNLLAMLTEGTVAWTDYMGYINRHSTYADLPMTGQWKKMLKAYHSSSRLLEERGWMGHTEWRDEQLRAMGEEFIRKMSGALVFEPQSRVLHCIEESLKEPKVVEALEGIGCDPTPAGVLKMAAANRARYRKSHRRHRLMQIF